VSKGEIFMFGFRGFPNVQGGIETHAANLAPQLVKLGYRVTACVRSPYVSASSSREWNGVRLLRLWTVRNTYLETLLHALVCTVVAGVRRPEVVHIHGIGSAHVAPLLRVLGLKVLVTHHSEDYKREKWGWTARQILKAGEALGMRFATRRIAVSRIIGELVKARYGVACDVIPNGVIPPELPHDDDKIAAFGLEPSRYVLAVGRLTAEKRHLDVLRAFCDAKLEGWKLAIVGGSDHKSKYSTLLEAEARRADNVVMTGVQTGEALRQLYGHAGLFVLPSSHEGLPIALLEAMSYGIPVLVSDIPPNLEVTTDPARVFKMGDVKDLSRRISALSDVQLSAREREILRVRIARQYDWSAIALQTAVVYDQMVPARAATLTVAPPSPSYKWPARIGAGPTDLSTRHAQRAKSQH
jgi:glycosyltransferase involved in cell wall biosynthesis